MSSANPLKRRRLPRAPGLRAGPPPGPPPVPGDRVCWGIRAGELVALGPDATAVVRLDEDRRCWRVPLAALQPEQG